MCKLGTINCAECGMACRLGEYHPYAACLMFKACQDSKVVRENLKAVMRAALGLAEGEELFAEVTWRRHGGKVTFERKPIDQAPDWVQRAHERFHGADASVDADNAKAADRARTLDAARIALAQQPSREAAPIEIKMLPLTTRLAASGLKSEIVNFAERMVEHNVAARDAEIEALRAERDLFRDETIELVRQNGEWQARAEQLAEAQPVACPRDVTSNVTSLVTERHHLSPEECRQMSPPPYRGGDIGDVPATGDNAAAYRAAKDGE